MARFRINNIAELARQMQFTPQAARTAQLDAAERLLHLVDAGKVYPLDFVIYSITGYRPRKGGQVLLTGMALLHDLGLLLETVSAKLCLQAGSAGEPVLGIGDLTEQFNVTSKTIQRWRRRGLAARIYYFADGRQRVGFRLSSVERFFVDRSVEVDAERLLGPVGRSELAAILRHARRLAFEGGCCVEEIVQRVARKTGRTPLSIVHQLRDHDQRNPRQAILWGALPPMSPRERRLVQRARQRGISLGQIARHLRRPLSTIYRAVMDQRLAAISRCRVRFHDDPLYHQADATAVIEALVQQDSLPAEPQVAESRRCGDLPPYLADLWRIALLSPARERALFLKLNYHKFRFVMARRRSQPELVRAQQLRAMESQLRQAAEVKNQIIQANLRLVVSVARKHVRPGLLLADLVSEGNLTLMRAVDGFDVHRGGRFSTYATLALMKNFARQVPMLLAGSGAVTGQSIEDMADHAWARQTRQVQAREHVQHLLGSLSDRERQVVRGYYGLDGEPATFQQVGRRLGLSGERVRQIEHQALAKLRLVAAATAI